MDANRSTATFQFTFSAEGQVDEAEVLEVSGLSDESEVVEHKVVTDGSKEAIEKIPGRVSSSGAITVTRAIIADRKDFWDWRKLVEEGQMDSARTICSVTAYNIMNEPIAAWTFENAWPSKIEGPEFDAENSQYVTEKLTIQFEYFKRDAM
jgi:phage tail-like protein